MQLTEAWARIVIVVGWTGPQHQTCPDAVWVAGHWNMSLRHDTL